MISSGDRRLSSAGTETRGVFLHEPGIKRQPVSSLAPTGRVARYPHTDGFAEREVASPRRRPAANRDDNLSGDRPPEREIADLATTQPRHFDASRRRTGFHLWTPPSRQGKTLGSLLRVVECCHLSGLGCGRKTAAGLYGSSRTGSRSPKACSKHSGNPWLSQPRLADCCAILSFRSPSRPRDRGQHTPPRPEFYRCRL